MADASTTADCADRGLAPGRTPGASARAAHYELIRPVVLFGQSPVERAAETGAAVKNLANSPRWP
jgi:hypothetical protein